MTSEADTVVELEGVVVRTTERNILGPIDLVIRRGERWVLLGPNGSGKTTLLAIVGARRQPTKGRARVLGMTLGRGDVRTLHGRISHNSHALTELMPPDMLAESIVLTGKRMTLSPWFERFDEADRLRAAELLEQLGASRLVGRRLSTASQGERQRVLIARALFSAPELLLLDESSSGLDLPAREALISAIETAVADGAITTIVATHHLEEIPPSMTHAVLLRDGMIDAAGPIETVLTAERLRATFGLALDVGRRGGRWWAALGGDGSTGAMSS